MSNIQPTPTRPYLARAIYQWICDNQLTPYLLVDATQPNTLVPQEHVKDGQIVLNLAPHAVHRFEISNDAIFFSARFGGVSRELYVPMSAVLGLYARENSQGLFFDPSEYPTQTTTDGIESSEVAQDNAAAEVTVATKKKSTLRIVDE